MHSRARSRVAARRPTRAAFAEWRITRALRRLGRPFRGLRRMKTTSRTRGVTAAVALLFATGAGAQNLTITNARILDGTGRVIDRGAVVVRDGKIASVSATAPAANSGRTIDAGGKTVMPGLIDAHRHIVTGNPAPWLANVAPKEMQDFLDAGFTTLLCALEPLPAVEARNRINKAELKRPPPY